MMIYKVGGYTFSADLERYSKEVGDNNNEKDQKYTIGFCAVEYIPEPIGGYNPKPQRLDLTKPYELLEFDPKSQLKGKLAVQCEPAQFNVEAADEVSWLAIKIDVPNGDLDALIKSIAIDKGVEITEKGLEQTRERLLTRKSIPTKCNPETVAAVIRNTSAMKAAYYYQERLAALAEVTGVNVRLAEWLVFAANCKKFIKDEDGWNPYLVKMIEAGTDAEIQELVDKGYFELVNGNEYHNTELATQLVTAGYL